MALSWALNNSTTRAAISAARERCWYGTMNRVRAAYDEIAQNVCAAHIAMHLSCNMYELQKNIPRLFDMV